MFVPDFVTTETCAPGVRPNSGAKVEVWMRNSCNASSETRLLEPPNALVAGSCPVPPLTKTGNGRSQVRAYPIHGEIIRVGPLAVHTKLAFFKEIVRHQHYARRQVYKGTEAAPVQRHILHEWVVDEGAHARRFGIQERR